MRLISWNVNSIRTRLERVLGVLERHRPDLLCLQETKVVDEDFPHDALAEVGYQAVVHGQKTYNGVALVSPRPVTEVKCGFVGNPIPEQARVISACLDGVRVVNAYVVNGKDLDTEHYRTKLAWLDALTHWLQANHDPTDSLVVLGDFNIAPDERDVWDLEHWRDRIFFSAPEHQRLKALGDWGLQDLFRLHQSEGGHFSWWDYRGGAFPRGHGLRIDLILGTAPVAARCSSATIDRDERKKGNWEAKPSDHAPVIVDLDDA